MDLSRKWLEGFGKKAGPQNSIQLVLYRKTEDAQQVYSED